MINTATVDVEALEASVKSLAGQLYPLLDGFRTARQLESMSLADLRRVHEVLGRLRLMHEQAKNNFNSATQFIARYED